MDDKRHYFEERPPRLATLLLWLLLRGERGESVCGDLEEEWREQIRRTGKRAARRWYWRCAWQSLAGSRALAPETHEARSARHTGGIMESFWQDVKYAARGLRRSPAFTLAAVLTLALGIGANTAIFTVVEAALLRALPYRESNRVVHLWEVQKQPTPGQFSYPDYLDVRTHARTFEQVAAYGFYSATVVNADGSQSLAGARVSANFLPTLGVQPLLGRNFAPEEDQVGRRRDVVLLSYGLWQRRYGGSPNVLGQKIVLNGDSFTIIGVLPRAFHFAPLRDPEILVTLSPTQQVAERRYMHWMWTIARLRPGVTTAQMKSDIQAVAAQREQEDSRWHKDTGLRATTIRETVLGDVQPLLLGLFAAVGAVLLIACANVANMLLARASGRQREVGIRVALGAGRARLIRQFLTESTLLALLGGSAGLLWAGWGVRAMIAAVPPAQLSLFPYLKDLSVHPGVLGFTFVICLATGIIFGLAPALRATRDVAERLKEGAHDSGRRQRLGSALVIGEIALALVFVTAAGLLARSLWNLLEVDPGFQTDHLVLFSTGIPANRYDTPEKVEAFWRQLQSRIEAMPGVTGVAFVDRLPLQGFGNTGVPNVPGRPTNGVNAPTAQLRTVSADYFHVMGIPLTAGRKFGQMDRAGAPPVVIVNRKFAQEIFPGEDPLGKKVTFVFMQNQPHLEIVGVVGDENVGNLDAAARAVIYFPQLQDNSTFLNMLVRAQANPQGLQEAIRREARTMEPEVLQLAATMEEFIRNSPPVFLRRYPLLLIGSFAGASLLLAAIGIYGVMAYAVSQRTNEIGIRMAIGAQPRDVFTLILKEGLGLTLAGVALGLLGAFTITRVLSTILFQVASVDPLTFSAAAGLLTFVALLACYAPARRAAHMDPLVALRHE